MSVTQKPVWFKVKLPGGDSYHRLRSLIKEHRLHTVCEEALCPNMAECWGGGTATLMLMGDVCTRGCRFCHVKSGNPKGVLDEQEPLKVAKTIQHLGLTYVVLTSVDRDDLPDGGARHFARTVACIKEFCPGILVEALTPDFQGDLGAIQTVVSSPLDVFAHNLETVRRLTPRARDKRATYEQSLRVLQKGKEIALRTLYTKSSLMLGLGETEKEVEEALQDLRAVGVDFLTLGQYLQPTSWHLAVEEYISPKVFHQWKEKGLEMGFRYVAAGPLVRSSYKAGEFFISHILRQEQHL